MKTASIRVDTLMGMDTRHKARPEFASYIRDMWYDRAGCWRSMPGYAPVLTGEAVSALVETMHYFSQHNGARKFLVYEKRYGNGLRMEYMNGQSGAGALIQDRFFAGELAPRTQYAAWSNWLFFVNGHDVPSRWNGRLLRRIGFDRAAPPPRLDDNESSGLDAYDLFGTDLAATANTVRQWGVGPKPDSIVLPEVPWMYGYALAWVNDLGAESPLSDVVFARGVNLDPGGRRTVRVVIPEAPIHALGWRLYRTQNLLPVLATDVGATYVLRPIEVPASEGVTLYHLVSGTGGVEVEYIDELTDSRLGSEYNRDSTGQVPPGAKYLAFFKSTMFVGGTPEYPDRVWYSFAESVEQFPPQNYLQIGNRNSGEMTAFRATKNALIVFKQRGIYLIKGDQSQGFFSQTLTEDEGALASKALVEVPGRGLMVVGSGGIYLIEGALENTGTVTQVRRISGPIDAVWAQRVNQKSLVASQGVYSHERNEVWIQVPADGEHRPSLGLVYHTELDSWSLREGWPANCFVESQDEYNRLFMGSWDSNHPGIQLISEGYTSKDGVALSSAYRTGWIDAGSPDDRNVYVHFIPFVLYDGADLALVYRRDRHTTTEQVEQTLPQADFDDLRTVWNVGTWGTTRWSDYTMAPLAFDLVGTEGGTGFLAREAQFEVSASRMVLLGYDVRVAAGPDIPVLSGAHAPASR